MTTFKKISGQIVVKIKHIFVRNFKGVKSCEIKNLSQVNLLIGKNNSGKSTILEAIYLFNLLAENNPKDITRILKRREHRNQWSVRELYFDRETTEPIEITLVFDDGEQVSIRTNHAIADLTHFETVISSAKEKNKVRGHRFNLMLSCQTSYGHKIEEVLPDVVLDFIRNMCLLDDYLIHEIAEVESVYLRKVKEEGIDIEAMNTYRRIYDDKAINWECIPYREASDNRVVITSRGRRLLIGGLGDGAKVGLILPNIAAHLHDTALLIEEIETHQHPLAIRELVNDLFKISRQNNLQLIITTHSPDVYRYVSLIPDSKIYHLNRQNGNVHAKPVDKKSLEVLYDIGWDMNNVLNFEKFIIVEGLYDMEVLRHFFRKMTNSWPEERGISIIPAKGKNKVKEIAKSVAHLGRKYFVVVDADTQEDKELVREYILNSFKSLKEEGYEEIPSDQSKLELRHRSSGTKIVIIKDNIFVAGLPNKFHKVRRHTMEDYLIEIILQSRPGYSEHDIEGEDSKQVLRNILGHYEIDDIRDIIEQAKEIPGEINAFLNRVLRS